MSPLGPGVPIALAAGNALTNLTLRLPQGAVIAGTVRRADGTPAVNARVFASSHGVNGDTMTDARGAYRISGLWPGEYAIAAGGGRAVVPIFYPGTADPGAATTIRVTEDEERDGIDFSMVLAQPTRVSGVVVGPDGQPVPGAQPFMTALPWDGYGPTLTVGPGADGRFVFSDVIPGHYQVRATVPPGPAPVSAESDNVVRLTASEDIDVTGEEISGLTVWLQPPLVISGRVEFDRASHPLLHDRPSVRVFLTRPGTHPSEVTVESDGRFESHMLPGLYEVDAVASEVPPHGWWLRSAIANGRDLLDDPPELDRVSGDLTGVVLAFSDRHTQLSGTVKSSEGAPVTECFVVVFPADRKFWNAFSRRLTITRPATNGGFLFRDLPPGEYLINTVPAVDSSEWRKPEFLEPLVPASMHVTLREGEQKTQDLRLASASGKRP
jgi:protocatechuate 3,4-dioxygenase beta subunit